MRVRARRRRTTKFLWCAPRSCRHARPRRRRLRRRRRAHQLRRRTSRGGSRCRLSVRRTRAAARLLRMQVRPQAHKRVCARSSSPLPLLPSLPHLLPPPTLLPSPPSPPPSIPPPPRLLRMLVARGAPRGVAGAKYGAQSRRSDSVTGGSRARRRSAPVQDLSQALPRPGSNCGGRERLCSECVGTHFTSYVQLVSVLQEDLRRPAGMQTTGGRWQGVLPATNSACASPR